MEKVSCILHYFHFIALAMSICASDPLAHSTLPDAEAFAKQKDRTLFSKLATDFERAVISLLSEDEIAIIPRATLEAFRKSYASTAFRCRLPNCTKSSAGFPSSELRHQHETTHFRRVYCQVSVCQWSRIGFKTKIGLENHMRTYHSEVTKIPIPSKVRRERSVDTEDNKKVNNALYFILSVVDIDSEAREEKCGNYRCNNVGCL